MKPKVESWVIVRLDGPAANVENLVAAKAVYDSQGDAEHALSLLPKTDDSKYLILKSRRFPGDSAPQPSHTISRPLTPPVSVDVPDPAHLFKSADALRSLWLAMPKHRRRRLLPAISSLAELAVAQALQGEVESSGTEPWDIKLPDGKTVEVKVGLTDKLSRRSPNISFHQPELQFDHLALILFDDGLAVETARLIPRDAIEPFLKFDRQGKSTQFAFLRAVPSILMTPNSSEIPIHSVFMPRPTAC